MAPAAVADHTRLNLDSLRVSRPSGLENKPLNRFQHHGTPAEMLAFASDCPSSSDIVRSENAGSVEAKALGAVHGAGGLPGLEGDGVRHRAH